MSKAVLFKGIWFSINMQFSCIWLIDRTQSGATTPGQGGPGSNSNKGVLCIPQSSSITGTSPSDCLVSYLGYSLGEESHPSAEKQLVYSTTLANWATYKYAHTYMNIYCWNYFFCNRNIFLEGTFMVVTSGRKWWDFRNWHCLLRE